MDLNSHRCWFREKQITMQGPWLVLGLCLLVIAGLERRVEGQSGEHVFINKCCSEGFSLDLDNSVCVPNTPRDVDETFAQETTTVKADHVETSNNGTKYLTNSSNESEISYVAKGEKYGVSDVISLPASPRSRNASDGEKTEKSLEFRLQVHLPDAELCANGSFVVSLNFSSSDGVDSSEIFFTPQGHLRFEKEYYSSREYCLAKTSEGGSAVFRVCRPTCSGLTPCVRKCCELDQVWDHARNIPGRRQGCIPSGSKTWSPFFYQSTTVPASQQDVNQIFPHFTVAHPRDWCRPAQGNIPYTVEQRDNMGNPQSRFRIKLDGNVIIRQHRYKWESQDLNRAYYCLDGQVNSRFYPGGKETEYSGNPEQNTILFECKPAEFVANTEARSLFYGIAVMISSIFLVITLIVYCLLWDTQKVQGWTLMSYVFSLLLFSLCAVIQHFSPYFFELRDDSQPTTACFAIAIVSHFTLLSTFCWVTMVNFDLWCTFSNLKPTAGRSKGFKRFLGYAAFGVGVPLFIVVLGCVLQAKYRVDYDSGIVIPDYGLNTCHLDASRAQLYYAYGPAGFLLVLNLVFFVYTIYSLRKIRKATVRVINNADLRRDKQKQDAKLFGKLLFVMGVPWIFEIISWAVEQNHPGTAWFWTFFDLVNIFQAVAIFYIFVWKKDIIHSLCQKHPCFRGLLRRILLDPEKASKLSQEYPALKPIFKRWTNFPSDPVSSNNTHTESIASYGSSVKESTKRSRSHHIAMQNRRPSSTPSIGNP